MRRLRPTSSIRKRRGHIGYDGGVPAVSAPPPRRQRWELCGLVRVETLPDAKPAFVAGCVFEYGYCIEAAPILGYCKGRSLPWLYGYALHRGWTATIIEDPSPERPQQGSLL